ncbi:MAG: cysteinyl-tRNA synthetase [Anaerolineales bacterium]|nr:cysteinyl-tRNA synthetase [Anaerolineales bacterium]
MTLGQIAFLGSGETSLAGGRIFETLVRSISAPQIAILETPAGFELNASLVAQRVGDFLQTRLQNYKPQVSLIPARKQGTAFSPDNLEILKPLLSANLIFMGPGSPTYVVRQLRGTLAWDLIRARHRLGATLVFASAATISVGAWALPVYEIYKVGEDVHAKAGLNLFADYGMEVSFIPHWNNADGGIDLDTSRCFVGMERFDQWRALIPPAETLLGLDEHSGIIIDFQCEVCEVQGVSSVTILKKDESKIYPSGANFSLNELGAFQLPEDLQAGIRSEVWDLIASASASAEEEAPPAQALELLQLRKIARARKDFAESDRLRDQLAALGWSVQDAKEGQRLVKI